MADQRGDFPGLPIGNQGIEGQMHRDATDMAVLDGFGEHLGCEILGALAGIKAPATQIYGIGTVLYGGPEGLHGSGGGEQFQHSRFSPL